MITTTRHLSDVSIKLEKADHITISIPSTNFSDNGPAETSSRKDSMEPCCPVCWDTDKKELVQLFACKHSFCKDCLQEFVTQRITTLKVVSIPCPYSGCSEVFTEKIIETVVEKPVFETYQNAVIKKMKIREVQVKMCPRSGCSREFKPSLKSQYTKCKCGEKICNICYNSWHEGRTCLQEIDPNFQAFAQIEGIKFCVMCKTEEQRVEGCKHITCPICDYEWCWDCGREFRYLHETKCPKEWSPIPPILTPLEKWVLKWRESSGCGKVGLVLMTILLSPLILFGAILFWPMWEYDYISDLDRKQPLRSTGVILKCMAIGIAGSLAMVPAALMIVFCFVFFSPLIIPALLVSRFEGNAGRQTGAVAAAGGNGNQQAGVPKKRWMRRNTKYFTYTANARPEGDAQNQPENPDGVAGVNEAAGRNTIPAIEIRVDQAEILVQDMMLGQNTFQPNGNIKPYIL